MNLKTDRRRVSQDVGLSNVLGQRQGGYSSIIVASNDGKIASEDDHDFPTNHTYKLHRLLHG